MSSHAYRSLFAADNRTLEVLPLSDGSASVYVAVRSGVNLRGNVVLSAADARRLADDLHAMFPEPAYRVQPSSRLDWWGVVRVTDEEFIAVFEHEADARQFCDAKNAEQT